MAEVDSKRREEQRPWSGKYLDLRIKRPLRWEQSEQKGRWRSVRKPVPPQHLFSIPALPKDWGWSQPPASTWLSAKLNCPVGADFACHAKSHPRLLAITATPPKASFDSKLFLRSLEGSRFSKRRWGQCPAPILKGRRPRGWEAGQPPQQKPLPGQVPMLWKMHRLLGGNISVIKKSCLIQSQLWVKHYLNLIIFLKKPVRGIH